MNYHCICMSPAIDAFVHLDCAPRGEDEVFKNVADVENVGGKAINVARWLAVRGASVSCRGLVGEDNAALFARELARYGIEDRFRRVPGATRRNEMIAWPGGAFKINRQAFPQVETVATIDCSDVGEGDVVILSGSLPICCAATFYADLIHALRRTGAHIVLDASGEALRHGVESRPDVVKPNAEECESLVGFVPKSAAEFARATVRLHEKVAYPIISDGAGGCWFDGRYQVAPHVNVVDTTSAGDVLLAEWCWRRWGRNAGSAVDDRCRLADAARYAVAAGSAACLMPGSTPPTPEAVDQLAQSLKTIC